MQEIYPHFGEAQKKIRNNDMGARDFWRFLTWSLWGHNGHPRNTFSIALNPLKHGRGPTKGEIPGLCRT